MRPAIILLALVALALFARSPTAAPARAEGIDIKAQTVQNRFPDGVMFTIFVTSTADINDVRLQYRVLPDGANVSAKPTCTTGSAVNCTFAVGATASAFMVPGVEILYSWQIKDSAGNSIETPQASATYEDDRFSWESISDGNVTVYFYSGSDQSNRSILTTARETIDRMSSLLKTTVDFPVKVWSYETASQMRPAILSNRRIPPNASNPTTLGEVVYSDTALVSRDSQPLDIVRHEVSHIVMRRASKGSLGDAPAWVDEGFAVYSQNRLLPDETTALDLAIRRNRVLPIFSLSSSTLTQTDTSLFYAQSWSTVKFLIDTYGPDKFAQFIAAFRSNGTDGALKAAYGFDQLGLENQWRKSVGLPEVTSQGGGTGAGAAGAIPTIVPFGAQGSGSGAAATPESGGAGQTQANGSDSGGSDGLVIGIGALTAVVVLGLLGAGVYFARKQA